MKDDDTHIEIGSVMITGWRATAVLILFLTAILSFGIKIGWDAGVHHACEAPAP